MLHWMSSPQCKTGYQLNRLIIVLMPGRWWGMANNSWKNTQQESRKDMKNYTSWPILLNRGSKTFMPCCYPVTGPSAATRYWAYAMGNRFPCLASVCSVCCKKWNTKENICRSAGRGVEVTLRNINPVHTHVKRGSSPRHVVFFISNAGWRPTLSRTVVPFLHLLFPFTSSIGRSNQLQWRRTWSDHVAI